MLANDRITILMLADLTRAVVLGLEQKVGLAAVLQKILGCKSTAFRAHRSG
jgi:hypothetical protein